MDLSGQIGAVQQSIEDLVKVEAALPDDVPGDMRLRLEYQRQGLQAVLETFDSMAKLQRDMIELARKIPSRY